jgi:cbb3-type cytochrome oxidase cytochrome c subunit
MAKKSSEDFAFDIPKLNVWFAVSSVLLSVGVVWLVLDDYSRDWKGFQREFNRREYERTQLALAESLSDDDKEAIESLKVDLQEANSRLQEQQDQIDDVRQEIAELEAEYYRADQDYKHAKSLYDSHRYEVEDESRRVHERAAEKGRALKDGERSSLEERQAVLAEEGQRLAVLRNQFLDAEKRRNDARERVKEYTGQRTELEKEIQELRAEQSLLERKLAGVEPSFFNNYFRNLPVLDMLQPSLKIRQLVLDKLPININFASVPRVDRCTTCHLAIDRKGFENEPQPYRTHPRLELYLSSSSPHPLESMGCTVCHLGRDRGTSFVKSAHTPRDEAQAAEWKKKYGWHEMHHWETPMTAGQNVYSNCYSCHLQEVDVPEAEPLQRGITLIENLGCHGCHKIAGFEGLRKVGPDLALLESKLERDWSFRWIRDPRSFRPATRMPHFFGLANNSSREDEARTNVEIHSMLEYLYENSQSFEPIRTSLQGDPERGREIVEATGCVGCHRLEGHPAPAGESWHRRTFGPELSGLGSKTTFEWLYSWLKNPKHYWPDTRMPDLRLSDRETADAAAYLVSLRKPEFDATEIPELDTALLDDIVLGYLSARQPESYARAELGRMEPSERLRYLGQRIIQRYGCFGCHNIPGFEESLGIGTELTEWGSKLTHMLDFGFLELEHNKPAWLYQKLMDPRSYDQGKIKKPDEKLKMPHFGLSRDQALDIVTAVMGFTRKILPQESVNLLDARMQAVEEGRRRVKDNNCRGCHIIEGRGGDTVEFTAERRQISVDEARAFAPPPLNGEGEKVQPDWLFGFLKQPSPIRPWLQARMPTFGFEDMQATSLVHYFSAADRAAFPFEWRIERAMPPAERVAAVKLASNEYFDCLSCHQQGARKPQGPPEGWAPDLALAHERLRRDWVSEWLKDPQRLYPGTRMPTYFADEYSGPDDILNGDEGEQIRVLSDYVMSLGRRSAAGGTGQAR